jgi:predicted ABC-type ATPase
MAIARVAARVRAGGYHVPPETVERRYYRGIHNFFELYQPLAATWKVYDNAAEPGARLIASGGIARSERIYRAKDWKAILQAAKR